MSSTALTYALRGSAPDGRIDQAAVLELRRRIGETLTDDHELIVIDLRRAQLTDPQSLSKFCATLRDAGRRVRLAIVVADPRVRWVLELCQIDGLELHWSLNAALAGRQIDPTARPRLPWRALFTRQSERFSTPPDSGASVVLQPPPGGIRHARRQSL